MTSQKGYNTSEKRSKQLTVYFALLFMTIISSGVMFLLVGTGNDLLVLASIAFVSLIVFIKTINEKSKTAIIVYIATTLILAVSILYIFFVNDGKFDTTAIRANIGIFSILMTVGSQFSLAFLIFGFKLIYNATKHKENPELNIKIENFIKDKSIKECPFVINGNETLKVDPMGKVGNIILALWMIISLIGSIATLSIGPLAIGIFVGAAMIWFFRVIYSFFPKYARDVKRIEVIDEYFKRRFDILKEFNIEKHEKLDTFSIKEQKSYDDIMFDIYMKAYNLNADAIVVNDYIYSRPNSTGKISDLANKSSVHLTGMIIKYR